MPLAKKTTVGRSLSPLDHSARYETGITFSFGERCSFIKPPVWWPASNRSHDMEKREAKVEIRQEECNPYGIQLDAPMLKDAAVGSRQMKPYGFPQDARWYWNGLDG